MATNGVSLVTFKLPILTVVMAMAAGCGTTVVTSTDPGARLYAEGRLLGVGRGEMQRRGTPGSITVTAVAQDGRRAQAKASRSFTGFTFLTGLFTYGICFFACWEYPDTVLIGLPVPGGGYQPGGGAFDAGSGAPAVGADPWLQPPAGWQGKPSTSPPAVPKSSAGPAPAPAPPPPGVEATTTPPHR